MALEQQSIGRNSIVTTTGSALHSESIVPAAVHVQNGSENVLLAGSNFSSITEGLGWYLNGNIAH